MPQKSGVSLYQIVIIFIAAASRKEQPVYLDTWYKKVPPDAVSEGIEFSQQSGLFKDPGVDGAIPRDDFSGGEPQGNLFDAVFGRV